MTGFGHGSRAAQPCISPLTHERCPTHAQSRGADGCSICTPATWRTWGGAKPHGVNKPLGGRVSRGYSVPKALILLGFLRLGIYANRRAVLRAGYALMPHLCTCEHVHKCSRIRGSVCPLLRCLRTARRSSNGLSYLTSFRWSVKASLWPLAEPFQPKLGFSL